MRRGYAPPWDPSRPKETVLGLREAVSEKDLVPFWERDKLKAEKATNTRPEPAQYVHTPTPPLSPLPPAMPPPHREIPTQDKPQKQQSVSPQTINPPPQQHEPLNEKKTETMFGSADTTKTASASTPTAFFHVPPPVPYHALQQRISVAAPATAIAAPAGPGNAQRTMIPPMPQPPPPLPSPQVPMAHPHIIRPIPTTGTTGSTSAITPPTTAVIQPVATGVAAPKNVLHSLYGRAPRRTIIAQDNYFTWNNNGPPHQLKWSAAFVCPLTGEIFTSGRFGEASQYTALVHEQENRLEIWYSKKMMAEHAAAARCYDCIMWREEQAVGFVAQQRLGRDPPYGAEWAVHTPPASAPVETQQAIRAKQQQTRGFMAQTGLQ